MPDRIEESYELDEYDALERKFESQGWEALRGYEDEIADDDSDPCLADRLFDTKREAFFTALALAMERQEPGRRRR